MGSISVSNSLVQQTSHVCWMYNLCVKCLTQLTVDVLIGLGCNGMFVPKLWHFVWLTMGLNAEKVVETINIDGGVHPFTQILTFACQVTQYLIV